MNTIIKDTANILIETTKNNPMFLHIDAIGFFHFGENRGKNFKEIINNKIKIFNQVLLEVEEGGGNIIVPVFSYSITNGDIFDVAHSPSQVGGATEFLRKRNIKRRTKDPIFSYLLFTKNEDLKDDLRIKEFNTFGENSLIDKVFKINGTIGSIGNVLWHPTEAHYLEKKLNVAYRHDKKFKGKIRDVNNKELDIETVFYCRDLSLNKIANFKPLEKEMYKKNLVYQISSHGLNIDYIYMHHVLDVMKKKISENHFYFCKDDEHQYQTNI